MTQKRIEALENLYHQQRSRFETLFLTNADAMIIVKRSNGKAEITDINYAAEALFGYTAKEIQGKPLHTLIPEPYRDIHHAHVDHYLANPHPRPMGANHDLRAKRKDGSEFPVEISLSFNEQTQETITHIVDITERKAMQAALELSENRYKVSQRIANIGTWDWNIVTNDLYWSETIEPLFGFERGEFNKTYEAFLACVHPEDRQKVIDAVDKAVQGLAEYSIEHRIVWPNGETRWMKEVANVMRDADNTPTRMIGIVQDITEHKYLETQKLQLLLEQERRKILSNFITQTSHEFRTPLSIIGTSTHLLHRLMDSDDQHRHIQKIEVQIEKITTLVESMTELSALDNGSTLDYSDTNINNLISLIIDNVERTKNHTFIIEETSDIPLLNLDTVYVKQALGKIIQNAVTYTPENGTIMIKTFTDKANVVIEVCDTGIGMTKDEITNIFKRFYRVEKSGAVPGFGLGLPIAKAIIERHGGSISVDSTEGQGTQVTIRLPITNG